MSDLTYKRFDPLITWLNYYNAVVEGDTKKVDTALLYYHTGAQTVPLDGHDPALVLAARKGRTEIVKQLLGHITFRKISKEKRDFIVNSALETVCRFDSESHFDIMRILLRIATAVVKTDDMLLKESLMRNNTVALEALIQERESSCPEFLIELAVREGHTCIWKSGVIDKKDVTYPSGFSDINKALFVNDKDIVKSWADEYSVGTVGEMDAAKLVLVRDAFKYCAMIGDIELFHFLRSMFVSSAKLSVWMEVACDTACEYGQCDIVKTLMQNRWVDINFGYEWKSRLDKAVKKDHTSVSCYLMDTMFVHQRPVTEFGVRGKIRDPNSDFYKDLAELSTSKSNLLITEKLIQCRAVMYLSERIAQWTPRCFEKALKSGCIEMVKMYKRLGAYFTPSRKTRSSKRNCWCNVLRLLGNPVIIEIMNAHCTCHAEILWRDIFLQSEETFAMIFDRPSLVWKRKALLCHLKFAFLKNLPIFSAIIMFFDIGSSDLEDGMLGGDICPASLADIMSMFTHMCGSSIQALASMPNLMEVVTQLDDDLQDEFFSVVKFCGIKFIDTYLEAQRKREILLPVIENCLSLEGLCRISIRKTIRKKASLMSMKDAVLSLHNILPLTLQEYLLFRDIDYSKKAKTTIVKCHGANSRLLAKEYSGKIIRSLLHRAAPSGQYLAADSSSEENECYDYGDEPIDDTDVQRCIVA